jgi:xylan 1,4-beta-xylosidase
MENGVRGAPDVNAVATRDDAGISVLLWNYHDDDVEDGAATVSLGLGGIGNRDLAMRHYRMDKDHSNAHAVWKAMGSPQQLEGADYERLEAAGKLQLLEEAELRPDGGSVSLSTQLPRQGVSLFRLEW